MPSSRDQRTAATPRVCQWVNQADALEHFVRYEGATQSQQHIKPLHWYVACRLVLEGGFHPDEIKPRPPFTVTKRRGQHFLHFDPDAATGGEATVLGGLKTKNVDVVISKDGLGPVLAVSCKGMTGAFRNSHQPHGRDDWGVHEPAHHLPGPRVRIPVRHPCQRGAQRRSFGESASKRATCAANRPQRYRDYGILRARGVDCPVSTPRSARSPDATASGRTPVDTRQSRLR